MSMPAATPVVEAKDLKRVYEIRRGFMRAPDHLQAVGGVSFAVHAGKTLAVVGESGCGKSTLARMVSLIETPTGGQLRIKGVDAVNAPHDERLKLRKAVQLVFQNPYGSLNPRKKIGAILEAPLEINTALTAAERAGKARAMLAMVGLRPEHYDRYPHMFSGGQRQRIAIARALMLNPTLVVADEPVSALDVSIQAQVLNLLADLQQSMGLAYLFISHDLGVVSEMAQRVAVMYAGQIMEEQSTHALFNMPQHPYTEALLSALPERSDGSARLATIPGMVPGLYDRPTGCLFAPRCAYATEHCADVRPPLRPWQSASQAGGIVRCHYPLGDPDREAAMLQGKPLMVEAAV